MRLLLQYLLPLLLPFLVYVAYVAVTEGRTPAWLDETPWLMLAGAGVVLLAVSLITWSLLSGSPTSAIYVPPHFEDGRVVPSTTVDR